MPLKKESKLPAMKDWPNKSTNDPYEVLSWWHGPFAGCEAGVLTGPVSARASGIWVLDIDVKWFNGFTTLKNLFHSHGETSLPDTFRVKSPSGGQQWYFLWPLDDDGNERMVKNIGSEPDRPGPLGAELEARGWHGQVVAPGSVTREIINDTMPIRAPRWLEDIVCASRAKPSAVTDAKTTQDGTNIVLTYANRLSRVQHGRNSALNTMAFQLGILGARGLVEEFVALDALRDACVDNGAIGGEDAWKDGQFEATFNSGWIAGLAEGAK